MTFSLVFKTIKDEMMIVIKLVFLAKCQMSKIVQNDMQNDKKMNLIHHMIYHGHYPTQYKSYICSLLWQLKSGQKSEKDQVIAECVLKDTRPKLLLSLEAKTEHKLVPLHVFLI